MHIPVIALAAGAAAAALSAPQDGDPVIRPLLTFAGPTSAEAWRPVHDRVMGGVSSGRPSWTGDGVRFSGELSLENNGGFASFRTRPAKALDLSDFDGVRLRVRGDGRNWKVSLRTGQGRSDHNWQAPFQTRDGEEWQDVILPFEVFAPTFHGRYAQTARPLDRSKIQSLELQVSDGQAGEYRLDVQSFGAWAVDTKGAPPGSIGARKRRSESLAKRLAQTPSADSLVETLRWSERVLVVTEPLRRDDYGKAASIQRGRLLAVLGELAARDIRVIHLLGDRATMAAGLQLGPNPTAGLRKRWGLPRGQWSCALIGKDGGVKKRWSEPFEPREAFEMIDVMPMRRSEARERVPGR